MLYVSEDHVQKIVFYWRDSFESQVPFKAESLTPTTLPGQTDWLGCVYLLNRLSVWEGSDSSMQDGPGQSQNRKQEFILAPQLPKMQFASLLP